MAHKTKHLPYRIRIQAHHKTKKRFLSHVLSVYDPMGIAQPLMLNCKLIQMELLLPKDNYPHYTHSFGWDGRIPAYLDKKCNEMMKPAETQENSPSHAHFTQKRKACQEHNSSMTSQMPQTSRCVTLYILERSQAITILTSPSFVENRKFFRTKFIKRAIINSKSSTKRSGWPH